MSRFALDVLGSAVLGQSDLSSDKSHSSTKVLQDSFCRILEGHILKGFESTSKVLQGFWSIYSGLQGIYLGFSGFLKKFARFVKESRRFFLHGFPWL